MELAKVTAFDQVFNLLCAGIKLGNPDMKKDFDFIFQDLLQQYDENDKDLFDAMLLQDFGQLSFFNCLPNRADLQVLLPDGEAVCCDGILPEAQILEVEGYPKVEGYAVQHNLVVLKDIGNSDKPASISVRISRAEHEISEILDKDPSESTEISQSSEEKDIFNLFINKKADENKAVEDSIKFDTANFENDNLKVTSEEEIPKKQIKNEIKSDDRLSDSTKVEFEGSTDIKEADTGTKENDRHVINTENASSSWTSKAELVQSFTGEKTQKILDDFSHAERNQRVFDTQNEDLIKPVKIEENGQITYHYGNNVDSDKVFELEQSKQIRTQEVFDQIVDRIRFSVSNNIKELKVELKPDFLGKLDIKLIQDEDGIKAKIRVDSPHTQNILKTEMAQLVDMLRDKNVEIINIDIQHNSTNDNANASGFNSSERENSRSYKQKVKESLKKKSPEINLQPAQSIISKIKIDCLV